jgi:hypothetical protein
MSFSLGFSGRSRIHALALLQERKASLPAPVYAFLQTAIENIGPAQGHELRAVEVSATGHLAEDKGSHSHSTSTLSVKPIYIQD